MMRHLRGFLPHTLFFSLYFLLRLPGLSTQPIFVDEAFYVRMAQVIAAEPVRCFIPLTDGKQPLFMWLNALIIGFFEDPIVSGRFLSVLSGAITLQLLFEIAIRIANCHTGLYCCLLWLVHPIALTHDRLAVVESLLQANILGLVWLTIAYQKLKTWCYYILLFILLLVGYLVKAQMFVFYPMPILAYIIFNRKSLSVKPIFYHFVIIGLCIGAIVLVNMQQPRQDLPTGMGVVLHKPYFYIHWNDGFSRITSNFISNLQNWWTVMVDYSGVLFLLIAFGGLVMMNIFRKDLATVHGGLFIVMWFSLTLIPILLLLKQWYPRYFLSSLAPLCLGAGWSIDWFARGISKIFPFAKSQLAYALGAGLILGLSSFTQIEFACAYYRNPIKAPWTPRDSYQFSDSSHCGEGMFEVVDFLSKLSETQRIVLLTTTNIGHPGDTINLYLGKNERIRHYLAWWWKERPMWPRAVGTLPMIARYERQTVGLLHPQQWGNVYAVVRSEAYPEQVFLSRNPGAKKVFSVPEAQRYSFDVYRLGD